MTDVQRVETAPSRRRLPRGVVYLGAFVASGFGWLLILWLVSLIAGALAGECENPENVEHLLPPEEMQHEPYLEFTWLEAEQLNLFRPEWARAADVQVFGYFFPGSGKIGICKGLSGEVLRVVRMHEEAHKLYGWRHEENPHRAVAEVSE